MVVSSSSSTVSYWMYYVPVVGLVGVAELSAVGSGGDGVTGISASGIGGIFRLTCTAFSWLMYGENAGLERGLLIGLFACCWSSLSASTSKIYTIYRSRDKM